MECENIARDVWAIVRPPPPDYGNMKLLLDLPWLWDVKAIFDIKKSSIPIGDPKLGELVVKL